MRGLLIVILKPFRQLLQDEPGSIQRVCVNIIPFERLDESLGHPVGFRAVERSRTDLKPDGLGKRDRLLGDISRTVVTEPLDGLRQPIDAAETGLHRFDHQVPDHVPVNPACRGRIAQDLPVTAVQTKGNPKPLLAPAGDLEGIGAPAPVAAVHHDGPVMDPLGPPRRALQQQASHLHEPVDPFGVDRQALPDG